MTSCIKKLREDRIIKETKDGSQVIVHNKIKYELHDKTKALHDLVKIASLFQDRLDVTTDSQQIPQVVFRVYDK